MSGAKSTAKAAMFEWTVNVVAGVIPAGVMAYPGSSIDVGDVGVAFLVSVITVWVRGVRGAVLRSRAVRRNRLMRSTAGWMRSSAGFMMLGKDGHCENEQCGKS